MAPLFLEQWAVLGQRTQKPVLWHISTLELWKESLCGTVQDLGIRKSGFPGITWRPWVATSFHLGCRWSQTRQVLCTSPSQGLFGALRLWQLEVTTSLTCPVALSVVADHGSLIVQEYKVMHGWEQQSLYFSCSGRQKNLVLIKLGDSGFDEDLSPPLFFSGLLCKHRTIWNSLLYDWGLQGLGSLSAYFLREIWMQ